VLCGYVGTAGAKPPRNRERACPPSLHGDPVVFSHQAINRFAHQIGYRPLLLQAPHLQEGGLCIRELDLNPYK
jgi:hypothetical protein